MMRTRAATYRVLSLVGVVGLGFAVACGTAATSGSPAFFGDAGVLDNGDGAGGDAISAADSPSGSDANGGGDVVAQDSAEQDAADQDSADTDSGDQDANGDDGGVTDANVTDANVTDVKTDTGTVTDANVTDAKTDGGTDAAIGDAGPCLVVEVEPNNSDPTASHLCPAIPMTGHLNNTNDVDFLTFRLPPGTLSYSLSWSGNLSLVIRVNGTTITVPPATSLPPADTAHPYFMELRTGSNGGTNWTMTLTVN